MSKSRKKLNMTVSDQGSLFDTEITEGALDVSLAFRDGLSRAISKCRDSRWQIAAKISELANRNISKDMLDKYTSTNMDYGLRAEDLPAALMAVNSIEPVRVLIDPLGCDIVDPHESKLVKLARLEQQRSKLDAEMLRIKRDLNMRD